MDELQSTGERMIPEGADAGTFWEHLYRYKFASRFIRGKKVLDIASGEGYGAAALDRARASQVLGVDIAPEVCAFAHEKYGLKTCTGSGLSIPIADDSFDVVVSFETIEHVDTPEAFLVECKRVLKKGGVLILSTPNIDVYSNGKPPWNPFHKKELKQDEFFDLVASHFRKITWFSQTPKTVNKLSWRSLSALSTQWVDTRGFWRTRDLIRRATCQYLWQDLTPIQRSNAVNLILAHDSPFASIVNPYMVRKYTHWHQEMPRYFLAVAQK